MLEKILDKKTVTVDYHDSCPHMTENTFRELSDAILHLDSGQSVDFIIKQCADDFVRWLFTRDDPTTILKEEV
jgi:hypothetical protein